MIYLAVIILGIVADQLVKGLVAAKLPLGGGFVVLPGILQVHYVQNTGGAWSIFSQSTMMLAVFSLFMAFFLGVWLWRTPKEHIWQRMSLAMMLAGAFGNMIDRFRLGYVVDFIQLPHWPVFNIADILLCMGVALLAVLVVLEEVREHKKDGMKNDGTDE